MTKRVGYISAPEQDEGPVETLITALPDVRISSRRGRNAIAISGG